MHALFPNAETEKASSIAQPLFDELLEAVAKWIPHGPERLLKTDRTEGWSPATNWQDVMVTSAKQGIFQ